MIEVAGKQFKTLDDELLVDGEKVIRAYEDGKIVYPELDADDFVIKMRGYIDLDLTYLIRPTSQGIHSSHHVTATVVTSFTYHANYRWSGEAYHSLYNYKPRDIFDLTTLVYGENIFYEFMNDTPIACVALTAPHFMVAPSYHEASTIVNVINTDTLENTRFSTDMASDKTRTAFLEAQGVKSLTRIYRNGAYVDSPNDSAINPGGYMAFLGKRMPVLEYRDREWKDSELWVVLAQVPYTEVMYRNFSVPDEYGAPASLIEKAPIEARVATESDLYAQGPFPYETASSFYEMFPHRKEPQ